MSITDFTKRTDIDTKKYDTYRWWLGFTLGDIIDRAADVFPNKEAVVDDRVRITYEELRNNVNKLALSFLELGIQKGDSVLLQLPNWAEYVYSYFALQKIGAVPIVLISGYKQLEVSHLAHLTMARAWIVPEIYRKIGYTSFFDNVKQTNPQLKHIISVRASREAKGFTARLEDLMQRDLNAKDSEKLALCRPHPNDIAHIAPSGGTTGMPKGIPRTHNDYLCNVEYLHKGWEMMLNDVCLVVVPVGHNLALLNVVGSIFFCYKLVLSDSTKPADICDIIQSEKVTYMPTVPSLVRRILEIPELTKYNLNSLRKISAGGEPSTPDLIREVYDKLSCTYINEFGMTEGLLCRTSLTDDIETICNTVGKQCCPYDEIKIFNEDGMELPANIDGELATKGPGIFAGYLKNAEENKKSFTSDGFFRTGDMARIDSMGYLKITGRIKDVIIRGGENISPPQIEELLRAYPDVADAAVIGMPDKDLGERVCAYVRPAPGAILDPEAIKAFMEKSGASRLLIPERFELVDKIPTTEAGKNDKKALRKDIIRKLGGN